MSWVKKRNDTSDHQYVEERLSAYLDGELSPPEKKAVSQHLAACQACQWQFDTLQQTVQWTRGLPTIPVPRVFTIPAPAQPAPAPRPWRGWVPLLQGATALIALLLVVVVAGDVMLSGVLPTGLVPAGSVPVFAPQSEAVMEQAVADVAPTRETGNVEKEIVLESEAAVEKGMAETEQAPVPQVAVPNQGPTGEPAEAPLAMEMDIAPTLPPGSGGMTAMGDSSQDTHEKSIERAAVPLAAEVEEAAGEAESAADVAGPTPTLVLASPPPQQPSATAAPTVVATIVAEARGLQPIADDQEIQTASLLGQPYVTWLRMAECALGALFVALGTITIVAVLQRRRAR